MFGERGIRMDKKIETQNWYIIAILVLLVIANFGIFIRITRLENQINEIFNPVAVNVGLDSGTAAPDFVLTNFDNEVVNLSDYRGEKVFLVFSSIDCLYCKEFWPEIKKFQEKYAEIKIVMISKGTDEENLAMINENDFNFGVLRWEEEMAQSYQVPGTPFIYLIDENGIVQFSGFSEDLANIEQLIQKGGG